MAVWSSEWPVLGALGRRTGHIRSYASWELQGCLEVGAAVGVRSLWVDCVRGQALVVAEAEPRWGVSADVNPELAETLAFGGDDDPGQISHVVLSSGRELWGTV